jgi:hypothetical protein
LDEKTGRPFGLDKSGKVKVLKQYRKHHPLDPNLSQLSITSSKAPLMLWMTRGSGQAGLGLQTLPMPNGTLKE